MLILAGQRLHEVASGSQSVMRRSHIPRNRSGKILRLVRSAIDNDAGRWKGRSPSLDEFAADDKFPFCSLGEFAGVPREKISGQSDKGYDRVRSLWVLETHQEMTRQSTLFDAIAIRLLARQGIGVIWQLHLRASASHRAGNWLSAAALIGIADAAERQWSGRAS